MKKTIVSIFTMALFFSPYAQNQKVLEEMRESEREKDEYFKKLNEVPEATQTFSTDYASYKRAKAWNYRAQTIFTNPVNPGIYVGGRYNDVLVDKTNNIALAAPNGGGLWSFNAATGTNFKAIDDFSSFMAVFCIEQNPNNKQEILVGSGDPNGVSGFGIFRSTNGGLSFTQVSSTDPLSNADFKTIRKIKYSPTAANTIYVATNTKVYRSTDNGTSWNLVFTSPGWGGNSIQSLDFTAGSGVAIACLYSGIHLSPSGNSGTYTLVTTTLPNNSTGNYSSSNGSPRGCVLASYATDRNTIYAFFSVINSGNNSGYGDYDLYKSTNSGSSWTKVSSVNPTLWIAQESFSLTMGVHPTNSNNIVIGSGGWGYSTDGGANWKAALEGEVDYHCTRFDASDPNVCWVGYDQGFLKADFGATGSYYDYNVSKFVTQIKQSEFANTGNVVTSQVYYVDYYPQNMGDAFLMGQQDGGCFVSYPADQSPRWRVNVGDGFSTFVNKQDPTKVWASTQRNNIQVTTTKGTNLNQGDLAQINALSDNSVWSTDFYGNNAAGNMVFVPSTTSLKRTTDNGSSFTSIATFTTRVNNKVAVQEAADPVVYLAGKPSGQAANILRLANAGTSNSPSTTTISGIFTNINDNVDKISIDPNNVNTVYVCSTNGEAVKITDANTVSPSVTSIKGNLPTVIFNMVIAPKNYANYLIAATNIGLFYSTDNGTTWVASYEVPATQITDLKMRNSDDRLFVATYGRGVWAVTVGGLVTTTEEAINNKLNVYPNPAENHISISTNYEKNYSVVLYNVLGEKVLESSEKSNINISNLSSGMYIIHLKGIDGTIINTQKLEIK